MIASASLAAALHGLEWTKRSGISLNELLARLQNITGIEKVRTARIAPIALQRNTEPSFERRPNDVVLCLQDYLQTCLSQIEGMVTSMMHEANGDHPESSKLSELEQTADCELAKAETPTDVQDIHF